MIIFFFFSSRRRHTRFDCDWSSDVCSSDLILTKVNRPVVGYGLSESADLRAENVRRDGLRTHFDVTRAADGLKLPVTVNLPGLHNVLNSLAAIAVVLEVGIPHEAIQKGLANFHGIGRRPTHVADV